MKKVLASVLALTVLAGATQAHADWFWKKNDNRAQAQTQMRTDVRGVSYKANDAEAQKWVYNNNNAYHTLTGKVATQDRIGDNDDTAFIVHPVNPSKFNASLRQGDTGSSMENRINQTFNN